eukprot:6211133-Pleurochrysis_carterae.AAC.6
MGGASEASGEGSWTRISLGYEKCTGDGWGKCRKCCRSAHASCGFPMQAKESKLETCLSRE